MRFFFDTSCELLLSERQEYLLDVFHAYFLPVEVTSTAANGLTARFMVLQAFPFSYEPEICIVYGHNYSISVLLNSNDNLVKERNVFIISCEHSSRKAFSIKNKAVYLAPQEDEYAPVLIGDAFGFSFDITDAELNLYNSGKDKPMDKLLDVFTRIN